MEEEIQIEKNKIEIFKCGTIVSGSTFINLCRQQTGI